VRARRSIVVPVVTAFFASWGCRGGPPAPVASVSVVPVDSSDGRTTNDFPASASRGEPAIQIALGMGRLCARADGHVYCAPISELDEPLVDARNAIAGIEDATSLAVGERFACAATRRGTVRCFGDNTFGQLGARLASEKSDAGVEVVGIERARRVFAGPWHACASLEDGRLRCWGRNEHGQTGSDTHYLPDARELVGSSEVPAVKAEQVAMSFDTTCARLATLEVSCWGARHEDRLANAASSTPSQPNQRPTLVAGLFNIDEIAAGESAFCGIRRGAVACWAEGLRLLAGTHDPSEPFALAQGIANAKHLSVADDHGCAILMDGRVFCFGFPYSQALGRITDENGFEPVPGEVVAGLPRVVGISVASGVSCALTNDNEIFCWGRWYSQKRTYTEPKPVHRRLR
jgi:hypothetical protein